MACAYCRNEGFIFAWNKLNISASQYVFRCYCEIGRNKYQRAITIWQDSFRQAYIPESEDNYPPTFPWIKEKILNNETNTNEFKKKIKLWGRQRFVECYDILKKQGLIKNETTHNTRS